MHLKEEQRDLFTVDEKYYLAHCISSDCALGAGIAVEFEKRFKLRNKLLLSIPTSMRKHPMCWRIERVFNLFTKARYWNKPTYNSLRGAIQSMVSSIIANDIKFLAIPKIGCGIDGLKWSRVKKIIQEEFNGIKIEILVCYIEE